MGSRGKPLRPDCKAFGLKGKPLPAEGKALGLPGKPLPPEGKALGLTGKPLPPIGNLSVSNGSRSRCSRKALRSTDKQPRLIDRSLGF
jgi:hypothetical protein